MDVNRNTRYTAVRPWNKHTNMLHKQTHLTKKCCYSVLHSSALEPKIFPAWCEICWCFGWHSNQFKSALLWAAGSQWLVLIKALFAQLDKKKMPWYTRSGSTAAVCTCHVTFLWSFIIEPTLLITYWAVTLMLRCYTIELLQLSERCHFNKETR